MVYDSVSASTEFIPAILVCMGEKAVDVQAHSIPILVVLSALALRGAFVLDKLRQRSTFCFIEVVLNCQ